MENQVTTIEQSERLMELGVPAEKASLVWTTVDDNKTVVERDLCLPDNIEGYAFTVTDLLGLLPIAIEIEGRRCVFSLRKMGNEYGVEYDCPYDDFLVSFIFCDTPLKAIYYAIEWIKKNWNKEKQTRM